MSDSRKISGFVDIKETTKERVALDLMNIIAGYEDNDAIRVNRDYWLTLYRQCIKATAGKPLSRVLNSEV